MSVQPSSEAHVRVAVERQPQRLLDPAVRFRPLSLPEVVRLDWAALRRDLVEELKLHATVALHPGRRELPLSEGHPCVLEVPADCQATCALRVTTDDGGPHIEQIDIDLSEPLVLDNVLSTLEEIQTLFEDRLVKDLRGQVAAAASLAIATTPLGALSEVAGRTLYEVSGLTGVEALRTLWELGRDQLDKVSEIHLERAVAEVEPHRGGGEQLRFRFSGHVLVAGRVPVPFRDVRLAATVLPTLQASLEDLLAEQPLASADLDVGQIPYLALARAALNMLGELSIELAGRAKAPAIRLSTETFTRSALDVTASVPGSCTFAGTITGSLDDGRLAMKTEGLALGLDDGTMEIDAEAKVVLDELLGALDQGRSGAGPAPRISMAAMRPPSSSRTPHEPTATLAITLRDGATIGRVELGIEHEHPLAVGRMNLSLPVEQLALGGRCCATLDGANRRASIDSLDLRFAGATESCPQGSRTDGGSEWTPGQLSSSFDGAVTFSDDSPLSIELNTRADVALSGVTEVEPIPELRLERDHIDVAVEAEVDLRARVQGSIGADGAPHFDFSGSRSSVTIRSATVDAGQVALHVPAGTQIEAELTRAFIATTGLGEMDVALAWNTRGSSPVLQVGDDSLEIFVDELREGHAVAKISPAGRLSFTGGEGLYDGAFLNALVHPMDEPSKWLDILASEESSETVLRALALLSPDLGELARHGRDALERAREVWKAEEISAPADVIPRARMARVLSRILAGDQSLETRLAAIIQQVTEGDGLDRHEAERIVSEIWGDHRFRFELDRMLRWLDTVLSPGRPLPPPVRKRAIAPVEDPRLESHRHGLPTAAEIYEIARDETPVDSALARRIGELAAYLTREQLELVSCRGPAGWPAAPHARLCYVANLKARIDLISRGYGGAGYAPQATAIGFFLADVIEADRASRADSSWESRAYPRTAILGPQDVAVLLQAGLASVSHSRTAQVNQRMLIEYALEQPPLFFVGVLYEMGLGSPRALTSALIGLLNQDQGQMRKPLVMPAVLSDLLGIELPRRADYMAGGRWAKESYFQAVMGTAEFILREAAPYLAVRQHLQVVRHRPPKQAEGSTRDDPPAREAIARADALGHQCTFDGVARGPIDEAVEAYEAAFQACRQQLASEPLAFQQDWFKSFWFRSYEALMVRSVLRNVQQDVDRVRFWLATRSGKEEHGTEQELLETVVKVLYHFEEDQAKLLADPLIRLLIEPPPGNYDFTIVSAMGVVTEGRQGRELEDAFRRLEESRGVRLIRSDTANAQTLVHNAQKVIEAVRQVEGPYGLIGYSQGCANVLMAESMMRGGTPEQQALLEGLRCRHLLSSALNGSAHGSCGNEKFLRAMVEGETFLKFYQAFLSGAVIGAFQKIVNAVLDNPAVTQIMGSVDSLSHEGAVELARDGQFLSHVPTTTIRGVVTEAITPEALDFLSNVITRQVQGALHDTQVTVVSAVGYPDRIISPGAEVLRRCDTGSYAQSCHHWSPLIYATELITTDRDRERAIYDFPKDRHVFPWIEVNARFGLIRSR